MINETTSTGDPQPGPRAETQDMAKFFPESPQGEPSPAPIREAKADPAQGKEGAA